MPLVFDDEEHQALEQCLKPSRPLHGLIAGYRNIVEDPFALDIKLHGLDGFQYVHGTTTLLSAALDSSSQTVFLYGGTYCGNHYRRQYGQLYVGDLDWTVDAFPLEDAAQGLTLFPHYLRSAVLACEDFCYRDGRHGYWLNWLSLSLSQDWHAGCQWLVVDRDHTVSTPRSCGGLGVEVYRTYRRFEILKHERQQADPQRWGRPSTEGLARECDLIAVGSEGELLLIDVRHGSEGIDLCWSALKLAAYAETVRAANQSDSYFAYLSSLLRRRAALGLCPQEALKRWPLSGFSHVVPVLVVAEPDDQSACWDRLEELAAWEPAACVQVVRLRRGQSPDQITLGR